MSDQSSPSRKHNSLDFSIKVPTLIPNNDPPLEPPQRSISQDTIKRLPQLQPIFDFDTDEKSSKNEDLVTDVSTAAVEPCNGQSDLNQQVTVPSNGTFNDEDTALNGIGNHGDHSTKNKMSLNNNPEFGKSGIDENQHVDLFNSNDLNLAKYVPKRTNSISVANQRKSKAVLIKKQAPSFLIIESLVWNICNLIEKDAEKRQKMYVSLCQSLSHFNVLGESFLEASLMPLREKISSMFNAEICRLINDQVNGNNNPYGPSTFVPSMNLDLNFLNSSHHTDLSDINRFVSEFEEIGEIARGGIYNVSFLLFLVLTPLLF